MSISLLYQAFGLKGDKYLRTMYLRGNVVFEVYQPQERLRCPACGSVQGVHRGFKERLFPAVPIGRKRVGLFMEVPRLECFSCGVVRQSHLGFADPKVHYRKQFDRYALELSRHMTIQDVADHLMVCWDTIKGIQKSYLERRFKKPRLRGLKHLAIDGISIGHGQRYLTVVLDLESGAVVFVGQGKGTEALEPFWRRLSASRAKIQAVAMDTSQAYIKEDLRQLWSQSGKREAGKFLTDGCQRAKASGIPMLVRLADLLTTHLRGVLASYEVHPRNACAHHYPTSS